MHIIKQYFFATIMLSGVITACQNNTSKNNNSTTTNNSKIQAMLPKQQAFQQQLNGKEVNLFYLKNSNGMTVAITNYGGRIVSLIVPGKDSQFVDVALGYDSLQDYLRDTSTYLGALIGRYGNRIAKGQFTLDGKTYHLYINNAPNTLHGGHHGFDSKVWDAGQPDSSQLELTYVSKDMEENFPGTLTEKVTYSLTDSNELKINYTATTDKDTYINLTNHTYFNLSGEGYPTNANTILMINADHYTPVDATLIPTGEIAPVKGTPLDFSSPITIGARIDDSSFRQIKYGHGYDLNFVLNKKSPDELSLAATAYSPVTDIEMEVYTTQPGVQFYSGNFLDGSNTGKSGKPYVRRSAFCLETQHYPDSPNHPNFPSTELKPGETFHSETIYKFGVKQ